MRVLIACEYSGRVRDAFIARGHQAVSCDVEPSLSSSGVHIQMDILELLKYSSWDLVIAFPPCTFLSNVGNSWMKSPGRTELRERAIQFVFNITHADSPLIAIENPVGVLSSAWRKPDQIIHPYWFGSPYRKRTCLWLKGLPLLRPTNLVEPSLGSWVDSGKKYNPNGVRNSKLRSITSTGIAMAMAEQWG